MDELLVHHEQRLSEVLALVSDGAETTWQVAYGLTWSRAWSTFTASVKRAALGETLLAHLVALQFEGVLRRTRSHPEALVDPLKRFRDAKTPLG